MRFYINTFFHFSLPELESFQLLVFCLCSSQQCEAAQRGKDDVTKQSLDLFACVAELLLKGSDGKFSSIRRSIPLSQL